MRFCDTVELAICVRHLELRNRSLLRAAHSTVGRPERLYVREAVRPRVASQVRRGLWQELICALEPSIAAPTSTVAALATTSALSATLRFDVPIGNRVPFLRRARNADQFTLLHPVSHRPKAEPDTCRAGDPPERALGASALLDEPPTLGGGVACHGSDLTKALSLAWPDRAQC